ncbi:MAG: GNAT family N-acetyltransferase [Clostridia bacterium]|nr:GNAT family N-acetyltransferase [Clostridia bacterium]
MYIIKPYTNYTSSLEELYRSVGWTSYLRRPNLLEEAYARSLKALAAYEDEQLVGIIRAVGDGVSILYIQDLLVHPAHQRKGIGTRLLNEILGSFPDVNQTVLITDDTDETICFYEAAGFRKVQQVGCCSFIRLHECYG